MRHVKCDICGNEEHIVIEAMGRFREPVTNVVCCKCGLVYQNPRTYPSDMKNFYRSRFSEDLYSRVPEELVLLIDKHRYTYIHTYIQKPNLNILEIGSGYGGLLELLKQEGHMVNGVEPSETLYGLSVKKKIDVFNGFLEDFSSNVKYDLILAFHVLEHVESPRMFMRKAKTLLKDDGRVIIETPDIWCLYGDPHTGDDYLFRRDHTYTFSENTLAMVGLSAGLTMNPLARLTPRHIWVEFSHCSNNVKIDEHIDDYVDVVNHVLNYRANFGWKQRLFNHERLLYIQLIIKRLVGEKGLTFVKTCLKKIGIFKIIEKTRNSLSK